MADIVHVLGDDWAGVYVNGKLFAENHSVSHWDWLELLKSLGNSAEQIEANSEWLCDEGRLPENLADVKAA